MKRVWDRVRAVRPSIYDRRAVPLVDNLIGSDAMLLPFEKFRRLFSFLARDNQGAIRDVGSLDRFTSSFMKGSWINVMNIDIYFHPNPVLTKLPHAIVIGAIVTEFFVSKGTERNEAVERSLRFMEEAIGRYPDFQIGVNQFFSYFASDLTAEVTRCTGKKTSRYEILSFIRPYFEQVGYGVELEVGRYGRCIERPTVEVLMQLAKNARVLLAYNQFVYPTPNLRLAGAVGDSLESSFFQVQDWNLHTRRCWNTGELDSGFPTFVPGGDLSAEFVSYADVLESSPNLLALILMFPWEADHLAKAREMQCRGIETCNPVGRVFAGEVEIGIFEWLEGTQLSAIDDENAWERYGGVFQNVMIEE